MSVGKKITIGFLTISSVLFSALIIWWCFILALGPAKIVSDTYIVGYQQVSKIDELTGIKTEDKKPFFEVNVFNNGFELKINSLFDENQEDFYSYGIQYIVKNGGKLNANAISLYFDPTIVDTSDDMSKYDLTNYKKISSKGDSWKTESEVDRKFYQSSETNIYTNYKSVYEAVGLSKMDFYCYAESAETGFVRTVDLIDADTLFKMQIGDEIYGMKLKFDDVSLNDDNYIYYTDKYDNSTGGGLFAKFNYYTRNYMYRAIDIHYLAEVLCSSASSVAKGTSADKVLKFGDLFNYFIFDGSTYSVAASEQLKNKIIEDISNYYIVKINNYDFDIDTSDKSAFNMYKGLENSSEKDFISETLDYTLSKPIIVLNNSHFDFIETDSCGEYILYLSDETRDFYKDKLSTVVFYIEVDFSDLNLKFIGIKKSLLIDFEIINGRYIDNDKNLGVAYV